MLLLWGLVQAVGGQVLPGPTPIQSEGGPDLILVEDLDGDQVIDLIASAPQTNRLNIHIGREGGQFRFPISLSIGGSLSSLCRGDFDGNGHDDLAGTEAVSGDLVLIFSFPETPNPYRISRLPGEDEPVSIRCIDLEPDGDADLLVSYAGADLIGVYRNDGGIQSRPELHPVGDGPGALRLLPGPAGGFALAQRGVLSRNVAIYETDFRLRQLLPMNPVADIALADWNGDPSLDLLLLDADGRVDVLLASGGNYVASESWAVGPGATAVAPFVASDGRPGAVVLEAQQHRLSLHVDQGPVGTPDPGWFLGGGIARMALADLGGDGLEDVFVPLPEDNLVLVLPRVGDSFRGYPSWRVGAVPGRVLSHDAVGGLPPRLYVLCSSSNEMWSFDRPGTELQPLPPLAVLPNSRDFRLGHIDGDGLPDLVVLTRLNGVRLLRSSGSGFAAPQDLPFGGDLRDVELLHADADPFLDIALADADAHGVRLFHGDGNGNFTAGDTLVSQDPPIVLRTDDFDLDGRDDVFVVGNDRRANLFYQNADGSWQRAAWLLGNLLQGIVVGNFNGDAYPDVAIGNAGDNTYSVLSSVLPRFLALSEDGRAAPDGSESMAAADISGDGLDDLMITSSVSRSVSVQFAVGAGRFAPPARFRCSTLPLDLHCFDGNGDGQEDIFVTDGFGSSLVELPVAPAGSSPGELDGPTAAPLAPSMAALSVTPNPSRDTMIMRVHSTGLLPDFRIYDLRGRLVARLRARAEGGGWYRAQWDEPDVAAGRYYLQVRAGDQRLSRPLLRLPR